MLRKMIATLVAIPLPPLGVWLLRGLGPASLIVFLLFLAAQALFWLVAAGPGVLLWAGSVGLACLLCLFAVSRP